MSIEFHCDHCGNLARTPDAMRGRRVQCPKCNAKLEIPEKSETDSVNEDDLLLGFQADDAKTHSSGPIEFFCKGCRKLVRTPATAAGKKGKCPHCDAVVRIPRQSTAVQGEQEPAPKSAASDSIRFQCPHCDHSVSTPASAAGKKGQCPNCTAQFHIPQPGSTLAGALKTGKRAKTRKKPTFRDSAQSPNTAAAGNPIEFHCQSCNKLVRTPASVAGKRGKCPHCQALMDIPSHSTLKPQAGLAAAPAKNQAGAKRAAKTGPARAPAKGGVEFDCPSCNKLVRTPAGSQGKKGKCPHCGLVLRIPSSSSPSPARQPVSKPATTSPDGDIQFSCPSCGEDVRTPGQTAGKKGRCPHCTSILAIPS